MSARAAPLALSAIAAVVLGCAHGATPEPVERLPTVADAGELGTCRVAKDPLHPMIVEWPATSRAELETAGAQGPVVVSYAGCTLKVLTGCRARGAEKYRQERTPPAVNAIDIRREQDLFAELPLGVASLKAKLAQGNRLRLSYVVVGERTLPAAPSVLEGDCGGATHFVDAMVLGGFRLDALAQSSVAGDARVAGAAAAVGDRDAEEISGSSGDLAACSEKGLDAGPGCQGILQLGLRPLHGVSGPLAGIAGRPPMLMVVPALGGLAQATDGPALAKVDVRLMELVQAAKRADADEAQPSLAKARAWSRLASYGVGNPYEDAAARRRDEWQRVADAETERITRVLETCPAYEADRRKLVRALLLPADVLDARTRLVFEREEENAYGAWRSDLDRCTRFMSILHDQEARAALLGANDGMLRIPPGTFPMGSNDFEDTRPVHVVAMPELMMDVTEVTVAAYRRCVQAKACTAPAIASSGSAHCTWSAAPKASGDQKPVNCVDWEQAKTFCAWSGKHLPTEAEWEYAARGSDGRVFPWLGNPSSGKDGATSSVGKIEISRDTVCVDDESDRKSRGPCAVATHSASASPFGLMDMAGNVWEWTASVYTPSYVASAVSDGVVIRGGSFSASPRDARRRETMLRADHREWLAPSRRVDYVGFRCAR